MSTELIASDGGYMSKLIRLQFEMPQDKLIELDRLVAETGASTRKEYVNSALTLFKWAIREIQEGKAIASIDANEKVTELAMPLLENVEPSKKKVTAGR